MFNKHKLFVQTPLMYCPFGIGNYNNEKVVYACTNSSKDFYYDIKHNLKLNTRNLNYWKEVFLMNLLYKGQYFPVLKNQKERFLTDICKIA